MGRSGSTVARYIEIKGTPQIVKHTFAGVVQKGVKQNEKIVGVFSGSGTHVLIGRLQWRS